MTVFTHSIYKLILALWVGGISLFSFIVTPEIFRSYGRDEAGKIVGKLFPGYFLFTLVLSVLTLVALPFCKSALGTAGYRWSLILSFIAVVINVFVFFALHPAIRRVKQEIHSFQPLPDDSPAKKKFRNLHAISITLNLIILAEGVILLLID